MDFFLLLLLLLFSPFEEGLTQRSINMFFFFYISTKNNNQLVKNKFLGDILNICKYFCIFDPSEQTQAIASIKVTNQARLNYAFSSKKKKNCQTGSQLK